MLRDDTDDYEYLNDTPSSKFSGVKKLISNKNSVSENESDLEPKPDIQIFRKKSDDQIMKEQLQKTKAELMQTYLDMNAAYANTPVDQRFAYPGAAENLRGYGAGGAEEPAISPIDFITPGMLAAPAKALGKGAVALAEGATSLGRSGVNLARTAAGMPRKGFVDEILPAVKGEIIERATPEFKQINGLLPSPEAAETLKASPAVSTPKAPPVAAPVAPKPAKPEKFQKIREILPGMYSKTESIIENKMGGSATPQQIIGMLREAKPEELEYLRIPQFLEGKNKVSKEELLEHIRSNLPEITPLPVKGQIDVETRQKIASANKQRDILSAEWRSLDEERQKLSSELMTNSGLNAKNQIAVGEALVFKDLESIQTLHQNKQISDKALNLFTKLLDNNFKTQLRLSDIRDIDNQLRSYTEDVVPTRFNQADLVLPKGEYYQEHLFQYSPEGKIVERGGYDLSEEGAKLYDDYEKQIQDIRNELEHNDEQRRQATSNDILEKEIADGMAQLEGAHQAVQKELEPLSSQYREVQNDLLQKLKDANIDRDLYLDIQHNLDRHDFFKLSDNLKFGLDTQKLPKEIHDYFITKTIGNGEFYKLRKRIEELTRVLGALDNEAYTLKGQKERELSRPFYRKDDELRQKIYDLENKRDNEIATIRPVPTHWDEPRVLAHSRINERVGEDGKRHLFAEEFQSDWFQKRRDIKNQIAELEKSDSEYNVQQIKELKHKLLSYPEAPLEKSWHEFLSKRLLHQAAEGDFDNVSWTTGKQQSERYNLSKKFSQITYDPNRQILIAYGKKGHQLVNQPNISPEELKDHIGKDLSEKLLKSPQQKGLHSEENIHSLEGDDLQVQSQGMTNFYDEKLPNFMSKMGKRFGVKPQKTKLSGAGEVWTMKLTPEMKASILKEKFPLFTGAGAALTGGLMSNESEASENEENNSTRFSRLKSKIKKK